MQFPDLFKIRVALIPDSVLDHTFGHYSPSKRTQILIKEKDMHLIKEQKTNIAMMAILMIATVTFSLSVLGSGPKALKIEKVKSAVSVKL